MLVKPKEIEIGKIYWADLSPAVGDECGGRRAVRVSERQGALVRVVPCEYTPKGYAEMPFHSRTISVDRLRVEKQ